MPRASLTAIERALAGRTPARVTDPVASRAAVALILHDAPSGVELLFIRRAEKDGDPWSGQMAFPGGRAEPGEDLVTTAVRETREEIGLDLAVPGEPMGALDEVRAMARMRPLDLAISPFVFRLRARTDPMLSPEVRSVHWLPVDEILGDRFVSTMDYAYEGTTLQFPCLRYGELVIWGLTFRMFANFKELVRTAAASAGASAPEPPAT